MLWFFMSLMMYLAYIVVVVAYCITYYSFRLCAQKYDIEWYGNSSSEFNNDWLVVSSMAREVPSGVIQTV